MKNIFQKSVSIFFLLVTLYACEKDPVNETIPKTDNETGVSSPITFGIRHDKLLTSYETIAANNAPYNTTDYPNFSSVLSFNYSLDGSANDEFVATGVLIAPNWILTAGHNFFTSETQTVPALTSGIKVNIGNDPNSPEATYLVDELVFHPTWLANDELFATANDLCLVKLKSNITTITPAPYYKLSEEPIGNTIWYCGYGDYSRQPGQNADKLSKKHAIENILDRKANQIPSKDKDNKTYYGGLVSFDFDSPNGDINALGDSYKTDDEKLLGEGTSSSNATQFEGSTVEGDSGGPLFCKIDNQWQVIGILSGGIDNPVELASFKTSSYGDISMFIRVSTASEWIKSIIE